MRLFVLSAFAGLFVVVLTGCASTATPTVTPGSDLESPPLALSATEPQETEQFLSVINEYRELRDLGALTIDPSLTKVAEWMANDMATKNYFSHTDSLGRDSFRRMSDMGYDFNVWKGENLLAGAAMAQEAFTLWKNSPGHNANMLNPNFTVIGIARAYNATLFYGWYWATEFGGVSSSQNNTGRN